ncbi:hypothetical protein EV144_107169 [Flavobacterium sp. 270]|uniref:hypothetical protein n=1 Tax=Flavobacterium sp. 270 TaxID=2512114 RepID=UPI001065AB5C|nr:hypothetical protein [Flavobacterium sp. 270]TDW45976.1 hypothetical protein EV144_107169 [Flavobacterium sp. 270]
MKNFEKLTKEELTKEELKSINAGSADCVPFPLCNGQEVTFLTINSCGWYLYKTATNSTCMEYGAS